MREGPRTGLAYRILQVCNSSDSSLTSSLNANERYMAGKSGPIRSRRVNIRGGSSSGCYVALEKWKWKGNMIRTVNDVDL